MIFYGVSVLEIFASFAIDKDKKYVRTVLVNTLREECFEFLWEGDERRNLLSRSMFDLQKSEFPHYLFCVFFSTHIRLS